MKLHLAKITAALALLAMLLPGAALAMKYSPPSFDLTAAPGTTLNDYVKVENDSTDSLTITLSALNFAGKAGDETSGVPEFYPADEVREGHGLAPWISFDKKTVTLEAGESANVDFKISVPKDASPGSHFGAVVMTTKSPGPQAGVTVVTNSNALVLLNVTGNSREDLKLTSFTASPDFTDALPVRFQARLENGGTVHERPYGQVVVKNLFGRTVATIPMNRADNVSVLPGGARRIETNWNGRTLPKDASLLSRQWNNFALGPYKAELTMTYGAESRQLSASTTVWIFPWLALAFMVFDTVILILILRWFLRWYKRRLIKRHEQKP